MGATEAGAHRLLGLLKEHKGTESFAHVFLGGDAMQSQAKAGDTLQAAVYGHDLSRRISSVASAIGIPPGAASSLMGLLMSTVVGLLGREVRERGLDAADLVQVLRGERETIERAMPADLVNRANRRPDRAALRGVEPPRRTLHRLGPTSGPGCSCCSCLVGWLCGISACRHCIQPERHAMALGAYPLPRWQRAAAHAHRGLCARLPA